MAHALAWGRSDASNVSHYRLSHIRFYVSGGFFFCSAADLADHNDRLSLWICLEHGQDIDKV